MIPRMALSLLRFQKRKGLAGGVAVYQTSLTIHSNNLLYPKVGILLRVPLLLVQSIGYMLTISPSPITTPRSSFTNAGIAHTRRMPLRTPGWRRVCTGMTC